MAEGLLDQLSCNNFSEPEPATNDQPVLIVELNAVFSGRPMQYIAMPRNL